LHPAYDGPQLPLADLWQQIAVETGAKLLITHGTAGGVGATTLLGDVVVADYVQWYCTGEFKDEPWAKERFKTSDLPTPKHLSTAVRDLIPVNNKRLPSGGNSVITGDTLTTDGFDFDTADDHYGLRAFNRYARAVEMDDGALGLAMQRMGASAPQWKSIRNASDPGNLAGSLSAARKTAEQIYSEWGFTTTLASALVAWAYLCDLA
jgi:nucleoside phosphorylase